jgi:hypothetical protein
MIRYIFNLFRRPPLTLAQRLIALHITQATERRARRLFS